MLTVKVRLQQNRAERDQIAAAHGYKPDDVVWADRNPFGLLVGLKNGTSRTVAPAAGPPPQSMNPGGH